MKSRYIIKNMLIRIISLTLLVFLSASCSVMSLLNSGTTHIKYTVSRATFNGELYQNVSRISNISGSIRHVESPQGRNWAIGFRILPSIHFDNTEYESGGTRTSSRTGVLEGLPQVNVKRLSGFGNARVIVHTPIGQFGLTGGFGGTLYRFEEVGYFSTIKTSEIRKAELAYTGFFTERFFTIIGPRYYNDGNEQYVFAFRLGYYWGE